MDSGQQGITSKQVGGNISISLGEFGDLLVSELQARYYESNYRGQVFSIGCPLTALTSATATAAQLSASSQLIVGVWNPSTSGKNAVILQAALMDQLNNVTSVALSDFVWVGSVGNSANLTAGLAPFNRNTLASSGSSMKAFTLSTASLCTGLTNTLVIIEPVDAGVASALLTTTVAAATPTPSPVYVQNVDGSLIVPPGGILGIMNQVSVTTHSVAARLMWMEVSV